MTDAELLSAAIEASGLSVRRFARDALSNIPGVRQPNVRTVWRWLAGENTLPPAVRTLCEQIVATSRTAHGPTPSSTL